ncbi:hypothetical protein P4S63_01780 [Pseudoalteromonas sp. B193]
MSKNIDFIFRQYYLAPGATGRIAKEIILPFEIEESGALGEALTQISERKVTLKVVTRGERAQYYNWPIKMH